MIDDIKRVVSRMSAFELLSAIAGAALVFAMTFALLLVTP